MVGFVLAIHNEVHRRGHPMLAQQFHSLGGGLAFIFVAGLLTVATFAPDIQRAVGADYEGTGAVARATYTSDPSVLAVRAVTPKNLTALFIHLRSVRGPHFFRERHSPPN